MNQSVDFIIGAISFILTIMVFSYILGDNFFFRLASYLLVGVASGYTAALLIRKLIEPYLITPIIQGGYEQWLLVIFPLLMCLLLIAMFFPRFSRLGSLPLAFLAGIVAALTIVGVSFGTLVPQLGTLVESFNPDGLIVGANPNYLKIADAVIMLIGVVTSLFYFHFGLSRKKTNPEMRPKLIEAMAKIGPVFIGITLGALFAGVYSAALLALISRITMSRDFIMMLFGS